ncbi:glutaredoxin 3 [Rhizobiales bacterium GAS191]|jgi:glutaredoxin 3|nr:glutaredoxin 3 [Rhizobiales bacterium GAS113]SEC10335.1 glutaredoxin 3 [Rhizobiales bacterium GAS191]SED09864.1 glutaredoxin 3 [Rhizobiales bacterium GAS188]
MRKVTIYTKFWCSYSQQAKALLERKGVDFTEIDIDKEPQLRDEMLQRSGGRRTVPQVFVGATHVGGCDDLYALDAKGGLDPLLTGSAA